MQPRLNAWPLTVLRKVSSLLSHTGPWSSMEAPGGQRLWPHSLRSWLPGWLALGSNSHPAMSFPLWVSVPSPGNGVETPAYVVLERPKWDPTKCSVQCLMHGKCSVTHNISLGWLPLGNLNFHVPESSWRWHMQRGTRVKSVNLGAKKLGSQVQLCHWIAVWSWVSQSQKLLPTSAIRRIHWVTRRGAFGTVPVNITGSTHACMQSCSSCAQLFVTHGWQPDRLLCP